MMKRGLSLAIVMLMVSTLGFASFGDAVKKQASDEEIAEGIKIEQPAIKTVKSDNLTISGTVATQGVGVNMSLLRLDGKELIDSASSLKFLTIPKVLLQDDAASEKEKAVIKRFEKAYEVRVTAGLEYEKAKDSYEKGKKDKVPAAKLKDLKEDLDKALKGLMEALEAYDSASEDYSAITTAVILSDVSIGGKFPSFNKVVKDVESGYYKLIFKRSDTDKTVKTLDFEVQWTGDIIKNFEIPSVLQPADGGKK